QFRRSRDSYISALLITSRGQLAATPCTASRRTVCRHTIFFTDAWQGCCTDCKWPD
ncbi:hypothetical protein BO99DRAFT_290324, partial [Aspergillus violaceofuscus CBS 115571]